jgi:antitoxin VapB
MTILIEDAESEALLTRIAAARGKEPPDTLRDILREAAVDLATLPPIEERRRMLEEITRRYSSRLTDTPPTPDEIIGYDENGLPA